MRKVRFWASVKPRDSFFILAAVFVTPGATAFTRIPKKDVSKAVDSTNIFTIAMEVEKIIEPGCGF